MAINDNDADIKDLSDQGADGTRLGTTSTDLIAFLGATPVARRASTTDLKDLLVTFGFLTDSGATPLNLDGGSVTASSLTVTNFAADFKLLDTVDIALATTTGTKIGTTTTQKLGFYNTTPVVQPTHANQAAAANGTTTTATTTNLDTGLTNVRTLCNRLRTDLVALGLIKGS